MAFTARLQRYSKDADTKRINQLFAAEPSHVYSMLRGDTGVQPVPLKDETRKFWEGILGPGVMHNYYCY